MKSYYSQHPDNDGKASNLKLRNIVVVIVLPLKGAAKDLCISNTWCLYPDINMTAKWRADECFLPTWQPGYS